MKHLRQVFTKLLEKYSPAHINYLLVLEDIAM
jgi:hypothetical protein